MAHLSVKSALDAFKRAKDFPGGREKLWDFRRLDARYRAATSLKALDWGGEFKSAVGPAYEAFLRLVLAYSAFEFLRDTVYETPTPSKKSLGARQDFYSQLVNDHARESWHAASLYDSSGELRKAVADLVTTSELKKQILEPAEATDLYYFSEGIRHAFVHGKLAPSGKRVNAQDAGTLVKFFAHHLCKTIDSAATAWLAAKVETPP